MSLKEFNQKYGRQVLIPLSVLAWVYIIWSFFVNGYINTWYQWHIPAKEPPFIDFRLIPSSAETFRSGMDPSVENPNDPKGHIFNYPRVWYIFFYTGMTQADTIWICISLLILFFIVVFSFPEKIFVIDSLLMLAVVFSPAAMLLYERGNVDLIIFILCGLTIFLVFRSPAWAVAVLSLASILKFFPFFGVGIFLQEDRKKFYKSFFSSFLIFAGYIALAFSDVAATWKLTQRGTVISYGVYVIFDLLKTYFHYYLLKIMSEGQVIVALKWLPHLTAVLFLILIFFFGWRTSRRLETDSERNLTAFRMGALIYIGTFFLGNNWDYRLAFLIFTIPQLSRWIFPFDFKGRWPVYGTFLTLIFSCWYMMISHHFLLASDYNYDLQLKAFDEIMNWLLFGGLTYLVFVSAPHWFRTFAWFGRIDQQA